MSTPDVRTPRLFYYEEAVDSYVPVPELVDDLTDWTNVGDGEDLTLTFKVVHMTDAEFAVLPEI